MSTRVMPHVMSVFVLSNVLARLVTVKETVKKSNASHVLQKKKKKKVSYSIYGESV